MENENNYEGKRVKRSFKRKKKKHFMGCGIIALFMAVIIGIGFKTIFFMPSASAAFKYVSDWEKDKISIVLKDKAIPSQYVPILQDDTVYYPVDFVKEYIDNTIYWEDTTQKLTITNAANVIRMTTDELTYYVNNEPLELDMPVYSIEETAYIPQEMLNTFYQVKTVYNGIDKIVILDYTNEPMSMGTIKGNRTKVYTESNKKSEVILKLKKESQVIIYNTEGEFTKIRTQGGIPGYILTSSIIDVTTKEPETIKEEIKSTEGWKPKNGKISMVWDQVTRVESNQNESKKIPIPGLNVISPTWFALEDTEGNVSNIADEGYVKWAHENGYQVWALFTNNTNGKLTRSVLSDTNKREKVIKQILALAALYDIDGINIDFESIPESAGEYYVQFIREITPYLKAQGLTVSVDMYAPTQWTAHYDMAGVGKVVDYVAIMAYDEHWSTSPKSGSVASLDWTEDAIAAAVELVDKDKVIMGVPFFTRLWEEKIDENGEISVSSSAYGMQGGLNILEKNGVEAVYDEESGQKYGEFEKEGATYKIWIEDIDSMEKRMNIMNTYQVAGIAGWKRGLEMEGTWNVIEKYLK